MYPGGEEQGRSRAALYPKLAGSAPHLLQALRILDKGGINYGLSNCGVVPICLLKGLERLALDAMLNRDIRAASMDTANTEETNFFLKPFNKETKVKSKSCRRCALGQICPGVWKAYAEKHGLKELAPISAAALPQADPVAGPAKIRFLSDPDERDPVSAAKLKLLSARLDGFSKADMSGTLRLNPELKKELAAFARGLGFPSIRFRALIVRSRSL